MPSARKRDARSPTPRAPGRAARGTDRRGSNAGGDRAGRRRRAAIAGTAGLILAALAGVLWRHPFRSAGIQADLRPIARQNVLLITIDTLRADALGCYGGRAATPALDRLAARGVRFDFAHSQAVLTLPSHASILTGTYPFQHGIRDNSGYRLSPSARTAATMLKQAGYATGAFVGGFPLHSRFGLNLGFDVYDDRLGETRAPTEFVMPERPATEVVALARGWLAPQLQAAGPRGGAVKPWLAWVHVFDPHAPYRPPPPFDKQYDRPYDGEVAATDAALAPLLADVDAAARPTLVIVTGDHGEALGDHGEQTHGLFAYESTLRVPLLIAEVGGRGGARAGAEAGNLPAEVSHVSARHVDVLPTILDAIGVPVPADLSGRSLLPAAERRESSAARPSYFEAMSAMLNRGWAPLSGVLVDRDKYIDLPIVERYDVAADPAEATNLAGRRPERDRTLAGALRAFNAPLPGRRQAEEPEAEARLRSLGYVTGDAALKARYTEADDPKTLVPIDREFHRGVDLFVGRRYDEAMDVYRAIIARRPDMAIAYRHLAFVEWESGQTALAVETLRHALAAGINNTGTIAQLGTYLAEGGAPAAGIPLLEPLAKAENPDLDAVNGLGIAYARAGRSTDARRTFERMLTLDPSNAMALVNLGGLDLERGDLDSARARFERASQADPTSSGAYAGQGVVALKSGDSTGAVAAWKRAVELDATNYDALYNLATTLARSGDFPAARPYLEQFARAAPPAFYAKDIREVTAILQSRR